MALIDGYDSRPRLARVLRGSQMVADPSENEVMLVQDDCVTFQTDGRSYRMSNRWRKDLEDLCNGDIVTVDDRGILRRVFAVVDGSATVFVTGKCNSNCVMCPSSERDRRVNVGPEDGWLHEFIDLLPVDTPYVVVTGGEPTLRTELFFGTMHQLAEHLPRAEVLLLTNGRSFASRTMVNRLMDYCPKYLTAGIPIHGSTSELHDAITQACGSFEQTCKGINNLLVHGVDIELRVVVSALNYDDLPNLANLVLSNFSRVGSVKFMGLETLGNCAKNFDKTYISAMESAEGVESAALQIMESGIPVEIYNYPLCAVRQRFWHICRRSITPSKIRYASGCNCCDVKSICGGFFYSTLSVGKPTVLPIRLEG